MKLRISGNSVRLRLKPSEVSQLEQTGAVEDRVQFAADSALVYSIRSVPQGARTAASYTGGGLEIQVPEQTARRWATSDEVSIEAQQDGLAILIEKDFRCMHKDAADADAYPNPLL